MYDSRAELGKVALWAKIRPGQASLEIRTLDKSVPLCRCVRGPCQTRFEICVTKPGFEDLKPEPRARVKLDRPEVRYSEGCKARRSRRLQSCIGM